MEKVKEKFLKLLKVFLPIKCENFDTSSPFDSPIKILKFFKIWLMPNSAIKEKLFFILMHLIMLDIPIFLKFVYFTRVNNLQDILTETTSLPPTLCLQLISLVFAIKTREICEIIDIIQQCVTEYGMSEKFKKRLMKIDKFHRCLLFSSVILMLLSLFGSIVNHEIHSKTITFLDMNNNLAFYAVVINQTTGIIYIAFINVSFEVLNIVFIVCILGLFEELSDRFRNIKKEGNRQELIECVKFQMKIHDLLRKVSSVLAPFIFYRGMLTIMVLCTNVFALIYFTDPAAMGVMISHSIMVLIIVFVPCYYGSEIEQISENMIDSIVSSEWIEENKEYRQMLMIVMEFSKQSVKLSAFGLFNVNLKTFREICNSAYSMYHIFKEIV